LELRSSNYYLAQTIEYLFDEALDNFEDCWKTHLENSNCTLCQPFSVTNLPMCNTSQEVWCIFKEPFKQNLWTKCNEKKKFLSFFGDLTKKSQYHPENDTILRLEIFSLAKEIKEKEEIDIITLSDLSNWISWWILGNVFRIFYLMEKCIMKIMSTQ